MPLGAYPSQKPPTDLPEEPLFQHAGWHAPIAGLGGTIFVAFVGALILLVVLHVLHAASHRRRSVV